MSSKPWDALRETKPPMKEGVWRTKHSAHVKISDLTDFIVRLRIGPSTNCLSADDLRQLAEFCIELADQLDGR